MRFATFVHFSSNFFFQEVRNICPTILNTSALGVTTTVIGKRMMFYFCVRKISTIANSLEKHFLPPKVILCWVNQFFSKNKIQNFCTGADAKIPKYHKNITKIANGDQDRVFDHMYTHPTVLLHTRWKKRDRHGTKLATVSMKKRRVLFQGERECSYSKLIDLSTRKAPLCESSLVIPILRPVC